MQFVSKNVLPVFSSKSFIVSVLIFAFRSLVHFEFIFIDGVRAYVFFFWLHCMALQDLNSLTREGRTWALSNEKVEY